MDEFEIALEASALDTIKVWLHLIPKDKVIERDVILASVSDIWVTFTGVNKASDALFDLLNDPTNRIYKDKLESTLKVSPDVLRSFTHEVNSMLGELIKTINEHIPRYLVKNEMTVRQGAILEYSREVVQVATVLSSFITNYTYVISGETETKERERLIKVATPTLRRAIKELQGNMEKRLTDILKLSNSLKVLNNVSMLSSGNVKLGVNNFGNPIWALRRFFVDLDKLTHEKLKTEAQLIELRILAIQTSPTPNMEERIAYFEEELAKITQKMKALERQYDDE